MAKKYEVTTKQRFVNGIVSTLARLGILPGYVYSLTVKGRKTGKEYTVPVSLVIQDGIRYLVSPYGEVNWLKNARAAGEVKLTRGRKTEIVRLEQLDAKEGAPILKTYLTRETFVHPYFNITPDAPLEAFEAEAPKHPVFRIVPQ